MRRAKTYAVIGAAFFAALFASPLGAQPAVAPALVPPVVPSSGPGFTTIAAFTLPPSFYVGDRVELRIRLELAPGTHLVAPTKMPPDRWITIDSIAVSRGQGYSVVHIYFVSFAPGVQPLPSIHLGGITLRGIKITTASLTAGGTARLSDTKGQLLLPGTTLIVGLIVGLLIGVPLAVIFIYRKLTKAFAAYVENYRARRPWRQLARVLDALAGEKPFPDARRFYIVIAEAVKQYLTAKFERDFRAVTAREFSFAVRATQVGEEAASGLSDIMSFGELVKFAGAEAGEEILRRDLSRVRQIVESVETSIPTEAAERERDAAGVPGGDR